MVDRVPFSYYRVKEDKHETTARIGGGAQAFGECWEKNDGKTGEVSDSYSFIVGNNSTLNINAYCYWYCDFPDTVDSTVVLHTPTYLAVEILSGSNVIRQSIVLTHTYEDQYANMSFTGVTSIPAGSYSLRLRVYHDFGDLVDLESNNLDFTATFCFTALVRSSTGEETMEI